VQVNLTEFDAENGDGTTLHFETNRMSFKARACSMSTLSKENNNLSIEEKEIFMA
jgi:hypothetical protein